jgi:hypothetical protein
MRNITRPIIMPTVPFGIKTDVPPPPNKKIEFHKKYQKISAVARGGLMFSELNPYAPRQHQDHFDHWDFAKHDAISKYARKKSHLPLGDPGLDAEHSAPAVVFQKL